MLKTYNDRVEFDNLEVVFSDEELKNRKDMKSISQNVEGYEFGVKIFYAIILFVVIMIILQ